MVEETHYVNEGKGILIVFEGISGCGKSENAENLSSYLLREGHKVYVIEWNSNKIIREIIRKIHSKNILTAGIYSFFQWISFLLDYFFKIIPLLKKNYILIADRYVYTGITRDTANGTGAAFGRFLHETIRKPDLIFFHDVPPQVCYDRIKKRGKILFHTNKSIMRSTTLKNKHLYYLVKLRREYLRLFNSSMIKKRTNIIRIKENNEDVKKCVQNYIQLKSSRSMNALLKI